MKSFRLDQSAHTQSVTVVMAWSALIGLVTMLAVHTWILVTRDHGWYLSDDPDPTHWTRSHRWTFAAGCLIGSAIGVTHIVVRYRRAARRKESTAAPDLTNC
jgi:hypothetical protein